MKVVYLVKHTGIATRTPPEWEHAVAAARPDGSYAPSDLELMADADVLVVGLEPVGAEVLGGADRLRLVQRLGVGCDNVDLDAAARRGVPVCNMPDFNAGAVAEHTLMLVLALLRRVFDSTILMRAGHWPAGALVSKGVYDLQGRTLGLLGFGSIGRAVAERARPFGVQALYWDQRAPAETYGAAPAGFDELLARSDVLSLHLPLTPRTRGLLGPNELAAMKPTALLVNTARGGLVDEHGLAAALERGDLAGAALDVFDTEPLDARHPLRRCPNVLLTPHLAGQTREAMERMVGALLENLARIERGQDLLYRVDGRPVTDS
jgi:phosphoglycerate dehydrogenase-like enzyme